MKFNKSSLFILIIIIISVIGTAFVYPMLPNVIPSHWGVTGEIDGYSDKWIVFVLALLPAVMYALLYFIPLIDPKKENYKLHEKAYSRIVLSIIIFIVIIHWITMAYNFYNTLDVVFFVRLMIGILFIILGNYMTQLRFNYFAGIRTPWTLADEGVWKKTHRVGGYLFALAGVLTILALPFNSTIGFIVMMGSIILMVPCTFLYSYLEYLKVKKNSNNEKSN